MQQQQFEILHERVKPYLRAYVEQVTTKSQGNMFVCPCQDCNSGKGEHGTGAFSLYDNDTKWKCFSCGRGGDICDLIREVEHITDKTELQRACQFAGIDFETGNTTQSNARNSSLPSLQAQPESKTAPAAAPTTEVAKTEQPKVDCTEFFKKAHANINNTTYHRGLSNEVLERFQIGYVENWKHPDHQKMYATPRLIIPIGKYNYMARYASSEVPKGTNKCMKFGTNAPVFNLEALSSEQIDKDPLKPIFIVEGEIDAMSIVEVGGQAVAISGTSGVRNFIRTIRELQYLPPLVVALDQDNAPAGELGAGQKAQRELINALQALKNDPSKRFFEFTEEDITLGKKDANEALLSDREGFTQKIAEINDREIEVRRARMQQSEIQAQQAEAKELEEKEAKLNEYKQKYNAACMFDKFLSGEGFDSSYIPTGFMKFDSAIGGGLYAGLYVIGATTSAGKTAFTLQIADQIAQSGKDVLYFTLEISAVQLIARSISRQSFIHAKNHDPISEGTNTQTKDVNKEAKTMRQVMDRAYIASLTGEAKTTMNKAEAAYSAFMDHVNIVEGKGNVKVIKGMEIESSNAPATPTETVRKTIGINELVQEHINLTGRTPVVFVDYLQILDKYNYNQTAKDNIDRAVVELKLLSEKYQTPVFVVSSLNRNSYTAGRITEAAYKETGGIEYTADCLIGLNTIDPKKSLAVMEVELAGEPKRTNNGRPITPDLYSDETYNKPEYKEKNPRHIIVEIIKCRQAQVGGRVEYRYYPAFDYFTENLKLK